MLTEFNANELVEGIGDALGALREILKSPQSGPEVRVQAAQVLLTFAGQVLSLVGESEEMGEYGFDDDELDDELDELEDEE